MGDYPGSRAAGRYEALLATHNPHKIEEFRRILQPAGVRLRTPRDIGLAVVVEETGRSFEENALLKAIAFSRASGLTAIADDSGLLVDALGGEPGVYSARFGGPGLNDCDRCRLVLDRLRGVPESERSAHFTAAIALVRPDSGTLSVEGTVSGLIAPRARGAHSFGYDPIFYYPPAGKTFGEMPDTEKDAVSHRGAALRRLVAALSDSSWAGILR